MNKGLHLSLRMGSIATEPVPQAVVEALTEVKVTAAATSQSGFQLKLTLGKNSPVGRQLLPAGFFDPRRRVILTATVNGTPHVLMDGVVTKLDVVPGGEAGASTLTVTGLDLSALMDFVDLSGIPYPALPPNLIVTLILAKYAVFGVVPVAVPSVVALIENPLERFGKQVGTDLAYVNQLGRQVGHVFYVDPGPKPGMSFAYWGPETRFGSPQPALSVNFDAATNVESLTFSYDGLTRKQLLVTILEPNTKIPIPIPVPDLALLKPTLAAETAKTLKTQNLGEVAKLNPAKAVLSALSGISGSADAVTASGQLDVLRYGRLLKPRGLVAVRGGGEYHDGVYYVKSVTHDIKRGKYTQSFSLVRGGVRPTISRISA
jgi:hypothetical protein